jgi:hypothetical protein
VIPSYIGLAFGALWLSVGAHAAPPPWGLVSAIVGGLLVLAAAVRIPGRGSRGGHFHRRWYFGAVAAELIALTAAQSWLAAHHRPDLLLPVVGVIVGLHFLGLWRAMGLQRFVWLTIALVAINLVALLPDLAQSQREMISGFGSAAALLLTAAA